MPEFIYRGKSFNNPVEFALDKIGGKWKMPILWRLKERVWRYAELKRSLKKVTHKVLAEQLRELENDGFVKRKVYPEVPPRVEYSLTKKGMRVIPIIKVIRDWGLQLMKEEKVEEPQ